MKKKKPKIFIGSSVEGLQVAYGIQENLNEDALCHVWTQGIFELSGNALDNLLDATNKVDYAIFIFQPDDVTKIRNNEFRTVRDNVLFEFGMFISKLGKEKVFFLVPKNQDKLHLPTDLLGIEPGHYEHQDNDEELLAALGAFCHKVRRKINKDAKNIGQEVNRSSSKFIRENIEKGEKSQEIQIIRDEELEYGVSRDEFGNYTISLAPTVYFSHRISKAFPGIRGIHWFNDTKEAIDRLELLLRKPIKFENNLGYGTTKDPIWWFRGPTALSIDSFRRLGDGICLLSGEELNVKKMAVFHSSSYYQSFVYIELNPDKPVGVYQTIEQDITRMVESLGYAFEEYGLFDGIPITRECYDDGAAVIDGEVIDTSGAELRVRYLSKYNFIIASKFSPINSSKVEDTLESIMNDMLSNQKKVEDLVELMKGLPRNNND